MKSNLGRETLITSETKDLVQQLRVKLAQSNVDMTMNACYLLDIKSLSLIMTLARRSSSSGWRRLQNFSENHSESSSKKSRLEEFTNLSVPTLHNIKATKATHTYKSGHTELVVQKYLRHEDIRTTQLYIDLKNQKYIERLASGQVYNPLNNMGPSSHNFPASTELSIQINEPTMRSSAPNQHWRNRRRRKAKGCLK